MVDAPKPKEKQVEPLKSLEEFFFESPLYSTYALPDDLELTKRLYTKVQDVVVDGHCPYCHKERTFDVNGVKLYDSSKWDDIKSRVAFDEVSISCTRVKYHVIRVYFRIQSMSITKVGQYPSLADIANNQIKQYRSILTKKDSEEFYKANGLAAHGVGVGSYVYLRRVFERLIYGRYEEFKEAEGWKDDEFYSLRMVDKIKLLSNHLPPFLVENKKIYSILSIGIHDLDETACLGYFEIMKHSILIILREDKQKREEQALKKEFSEAISKFGAANN